MELPPGAVDPIFLCELALELGMTVGEITHGRGGPMSAHELGVIWPLYFAHKRDEENRQRRTAERSRK